MHVGNSRHGNNQIIMKIIQSNKIKKIKRNSIKRIDNSETREEKKEKQHEGTTKEVKK